MISDTQPGTINLSAGPIDYIDTGGDGPTVVLLHGVLMNETVWRDVIAELTPTFRCIAPTLPLSAHRQPMRAGADLSIDGIALLVAEFLERLDMQDVTLIMNDWGGPTAACRSCSHRTHQPPGVGRLRSIRQLPARSARAATGKARGYAGRIWAAEPAAAIRRRTLAHV